MDVRGTVEDLVIGHVVPARQAVPVLRRGNDNLDSPPAIKHRPSKPGVWAIRNAADTDEFIWRVRLDRLSKFLSHTLFNLVRQSAMASDTDPHLSPLDHR